MCGSLKNDAVKVIQHLEVSAINYQVAWSLLEKQYKNEPLMIHNHIKGIVVSKNHKRIYTLDQTACRYDSRVLTHFAFS